MIINNDIIFTAMLDIQLVFSYINIVKFLKNKSIKY